MHDQIRAEIRASHRFDSFAGERSQCSVKWCVAAAFQTQCTHLLIWRHRHVDGHDYMYALSEILDSAKECIFILVCNMLYVPGRRFTVIIGLVVNAGTLPPSPSSLQRRMAFRQTAQAQSRGRRESLCHCLQRGYTDNVNELPPYEGNTEPYNYECNLFLVCASMQRSTLKHCTIM